MTPRTADPSVRDALVEAAAAAIARREPLTTRSLAAAVGTSTMAVYTHFGSLDEVRRAVRRLGFDRLRANMGRVRRTEDPVADVGALGWAYCVTAIRNPNLYRVMFMEVPLDEQDAGVGLDTFEQLVAAVQRCVDEGRLRPEEDAWDLATRLWAIVHGASALHVAGMLAPEDVYRIASATARAATIDAGDDPDAFDRSTRVVEERIAASDWAIGASSDGVTEDPL